MDFPDQIDAPTLVGLIPAAGFARRISNRITCSKEIYPIAMPDGTVKPVSLFLLESFQQVDISRSYFILRPEKWDIPQSLLNDSAGDMDIAYIMTESTQGVPNTLDKAYPFVKESIVLLGFPDIIFSPLNAFQKLLEKQKVTKADLVLGLFKTSKPSKADMVEFDDQQNICDIIIKPAESKLTYTWIIALWTPVFTEFMHTWLDENNRIEDQKELYIGDIVRAAIKQGVSTSYVRFSSGSFIDIGTPDDLQRLSSPDDIRQFYKKPTKL